MATEYLASDTRQGTPPNQTIFRTVKRRSYTVIDNAALNDARLSFKALGLLVFLLSKPDDWRFNYRHISTTHPDGEVAVRSGMAELEGAGYLVRRKERGEDGLFVWVTIVYEEPCRGFPGMDGAGMDNRPLLSTEGESTEELTLTLLAEETPPHDPVPAAPSKEQIEMDFTEWYGIYPRKKKPGDARKAYVKARKIATKEELLTGAEMVARLVRSQSQDLTYTPYPASWLNAESWRDEDEPVRGQFEPPPMRYG